MEILELHNTFADVGLFTTELITSSLPKGVYFIKVFTNKGYIIEKMIVN